MSESSESNVGLTDLLARVAWDMKMRYGVDMHTIEPATTPGYWIDREPRMHPGHPLHGCIGCHGPFRATYTYFDSPRINGRFASPTRTWAALRANAVMRPPTDPAKRITPPPTMTSPNRQPKKERKGPKE